MPYLTPDEIPGSDVCRSLSIPGSSEWLAIVSGALTELTKAWNWQQEGSVTVPEAIDVMQSMIDNYYDGCAPCTQPGGFRIVRIGAGGHVEELNGDGDYVPASGDYFVPPIPAREGGTSVDQICLAAENAESILHEVYNNLSDSFASSLTEAEALTALVEFLIVTLGAEFAPITYALALLILAVFGLVYSALSFLTADLWDSNFTKAFKCLLVGCASNAAGVVTFDFDCVEHELYAAATTFGISETQLRLYGQITYILAFTGGADMLNTAGATTGITVADCSECDIEHCFVIDFTLTDGSEFGIDAAGAFGDWTFGIGWVGRNTGGDFSDVTLIWNFPMELVSTGIEMKYSKSGSGGADNVNRLNALNPVVNYANTLIATNEDNVDGVAISKGISLASVPLQGMATDINTGSDGSGDSIVLSFIVHYTNDIPEGWSDNC